MSRVSLHGHGVYCYVCQEVYPTASTDPDDDIPHCSHDLSNKAGVQKGEDGYFAQRNDMGHRTPHLFMDIDGFQTCSECDRVKLPDVLVESAEVSA